MNRRDAEAQGGRGTLRRRENSWVLALSVLWVSTASQADDWKADADVRGDRRWPALLSVLDDAKAAARDKLQKDWRLKPGALPIEWRVVRRLRRTRRDAHLGTTQVDAKLITVRVPAHRFLARPNKVRRVVIHESAHAVLASRLGTKRYLALPVWLREGFALLVSGEGEDRVAARMALDVVANREPSHFLKSIEARNSFPAEGYMAMARMDELVGRDRLVEMFALLSSNTWSEVRDRTFGISQDKFQRSCYLSAQKRVNSLLTPAVRQEFQGALRDLGARNYQRAARVFARIAKLEPSGVLGITSRYYWSRALIGAREYEAARGVLLSVIESEVESLWEAEALNSLAEVESSLERDARAKGLTDECLERFPDDASAVRWAKSLQGGER